MKSLGQGRFAASLAGQHILVSRQPFFDGARALLAAGHDPATLLTMRHVGSEHVSFKPVPIGTLAKLTVTERDRGGIRFEAWKPLDGPAAFRRRPENARKRGRRLQR